jgi:rare lipoprotein A (peptidoglycan hydrolase)
MSPTSVSMRRCTAFALAPLLLATASVTRVAAQELRQPPQPMARQNAPAGWRTVVIPEPERVAWGTLTITRGNGTDYPQPSSTQPSRVVTASLPPQKTLIGPAHALTGIASYYWQDQMTSSGERFDKRAMTAAHRTLPLGTRVRVTHVASGRAVVVRINDRGPFKPGRVIDLSEAAAEQIGMTTQGLAQVRIDVVR